MPKKTAKNTVPTPPQVATPAPKTRATPTPTVKKTAPKKTATTKAAPKKAAAKAGPKKAVAKHSADDLARAAYLNYRRRVELGIPGDSRSDWLEAERFLNHQNVG